MTLSTYPSYAPQPVSTYPAAYPANQGYAYSQPQPVYGAPAQPGVALVSTYAPAAAAVVQPSTTPVGKFLVKSIFSAFNTSTWLRYPTLSYSVRQHKLSMVH